MAIPRFGEYCTCSCLPLLPQLICSILATWEWPYSEALYLHRVNNDCCCLAPFIMACRRLASFEASIKDVGSIFGSFED